MGKKIKLSILILSIHQRVNNTYFKLIDSLNKQIGDRLDVEVLSLYDNMVIEVGEKRNKLLSMAQGEYLTFVDDDDRVSDDYVSLIRKIINKGKGEDCIVFDCLCILYKKNIEVHCKYGIEYEYWWSDDKKHWRGKPAHTMVFKSEIAKKHLFRGAVGEDMDWVNRVIPNIKTQARIESTLYYYQKGIVPKPPRKGSVKNVLPIAKIIEDNKKRGVSYLITQKAIKYSFLMPYYLRPGQLEKTLKSFVYLYKQRNDFEIIIAEDIKNIQDKENHKKLLAIINVFAKLIKIVHIETDFKDCYNPAPLFNICAKRAEGEFLILTSPEVLHKNNVLQGFDYELSIDKNCYVVPSCESVKNVKYNNGVANYSHFKWYHHSKHRRSLLHWCNVLSKENYNRIGGFDDAFSKGIACEDDDFLDRIKEDNVIKIIMRDDLETIHIWHEKPRLNMQNYRELHKINSDYSDKKRMQRVLLKAKEHRGNKKTSQFITENTVVALGPKITFRGKILLLGDRFISLNRKRNGNSPMWQVVFLRHGKITESPFIEDQMLVLNYALDKEN